jgi:hypothetical protein
VELYLHSPNTSSWLGAQLKHRDNLLYFKILNILCKQYIFPSFPKDPSHSQADTFLGNLFSITSKSGEYVSHSYKRDKI